MKYTALVSLTVITFLSCGNKSESNSVNQQSVETCYIGLEADDVVQLSLISADNKITGTLLFENPESSKSSGTITGIRSGDTLKLTVRSTGSGQPAYREKFLLEKQGKLYEGVGEVTQVNDSTAVFANPSDVVYKNSLVFKKTECEVF